MRYDTHKHAPGRTDEWNEVHYERHFLPKHLRERPPLQHGVPVPHAHKQPCSMHGVARDADKHMASCICSISCMCGSPTRARLPSGNGCRNGRHTKAGWQCCLAGSRVSPVFMIRRDSESLSKVCKRTHCVNQPVAKLNFPGSPFMSASPMWFPTSYRPPVLLGHVLQEPDALLARGLRLRRPVSGGR